MTKSVRRKPKCWVEGLSAEGTGKGGGLSRVSLTVGIWCWVWLASTSPDVALQVVSLVEYAPTRRTVTSQATGLRIFNWKRRRRFNIPSRIQFLHQTYRFHSHSYAWWRIRLNVMRAFTKVRISLRSIRDRMTCSSRVLTYIGQTSVYHHPHVFVCDTLLWQ